MPELGRSSAALDLVKLNKRFGEVRAVDDVNLHIEAGEFMTFLGPSGSGKTTTLNLVAGFLHPDGGDIQVGGASLVGTPPHRRDMGMVFQGYALFPHLSVAGNVAFPLRQRRIPKSERDALVKAALATVRLDGMESRRPAQLSGGQQQRVALARALVYSPSVLLMDEPLGALDKKLRETLQDEIRRIHSDLGTTFVYVTHDQEEALSLSDRIAVYHDGRVEQVGAGEELYDRPKNLFVARFLGESTLLRGRVDPDAPDVLRVGETGVAVSNPDRITGSARLMLRPERVALESLTDANGHSDGRRLQVRVIDEVYLGHARKLTVELPTGDRGAAREIPDHRSRVRPGESAVMSWQPGSAVLLPEEETSADVSG